ncbi:hypothetical protein EC950943_4119B, partial [Escherichia coli 95.0943]
NDIEIHIVSCFIFFIRKTYCRQCFNSLTFQYIII